MADGAPILLKDGLMQSDLDANHYRIVNLDTSNLPPSGVPPTVHPPPNQWLHDYDSATQTWTATQPGFVSLSGNLTAAQQQAITQLGTIQMGVWNGSQIGAAYLPTLNAIRAPTGNVGMASFKITGLADPTDPQDAVTKNFMDLLLVGLNPKAAVRCASTEDLTPATLIRPVDGVTLAAGDRVLVKDQISARSYQNGIYIASTGNWTRATDANSDADLHRAYCVVLEGTVNAGTSWFEASDLLGHWPPVPGDTIDFVLFSTAQTIVAGAGLQLVGNVLNVLGTTDRIDVAATVDIAATYVGQSSITTLGTIGTGIWQGNVIGSQYGGTGLDNDPFVIGLACDFNVGVIVGAINPGLLLNVTGFTNVTLPVTGTLATLAGAETLSNKRITKRFTKIASSAQPAIDTDTNDAFYITSLATNITSMTAGLSGTPTDSQELIIWIKDNGTGFLIVWGTSFAASTDMPLPGTTVPSKWLYTKFHYSTELTKWLLTTKLENI